MLAGEAAGIRWEEAMDFVGGRRVREPQPGGSAGVSRLDLDGEPQFQVKPYEKLYDRLVEAAESPEDSAALLTAAADNLADD